MDLDELKAYLDKEVVLDTGTSYMYLGVLKELGEYFVTLTDVDVHDCRDSTSTKEIYLLEAKKFGIRKNRSVVKVRLGQVVSLSLLEDIIPY